MVCVPELLKLMLIFISSVKMHILLHWHKIKHVLYPLLYSM